MTLRGVNPLNSEIGESSMASLALANGALSPGGESTTSFPSMPSMPSLSNFPQEQREELRQRHLAGFGDAAKKGKDHQCTYCNKH